MNEESIFPLLTLELSEASEIPVSEIHRQTNLEEELGMSDESLELVMISLQEVLPGCVDLSEISAVSDCVTVEGVLDAVVDVVLT